MTEVKPHPLNVPGDFFVEDGCCASCAVWEDIAPDLLGWEDTAGDFTKSNHCYVKRQPASADEFDMMIEAVWAADLNCIYYRGSDPDIAARVATSRDEDM